MRPELTERLTPDRLIRRFANMMAGTRSKWRNQPLWYFVSEITGHGSTYSHEICIGLGFDPDHKIGQRLEAPAPETISSLGDGIPDDKREHQP